MNKSYKSTSFLRFANLAMVVMVVMAISSSCQKDDDPEVEGGEKFTDMISAENLAILKKNGMVFYEGTTPPAINGIYELDPWRLDFIVSKDPDETQTVGNISKGFRLQISEQTSDKSSIDIIFLYDYSRSFPTHPQSISGSGNNFTIYYKDMIWVGKGAIYNFPFSVFISGTVDGKNIKNIKMAEVGLKLDKPYPNYNYSVEGKITIYSDSDGTSPVLTPVN